ncbi:lipopolysaccharide biosynthesis protein [Flavobacteriaceae bacterium]|nr:lipopolysaccharide biosynthesis protein [Flavobacteriaceae bacterium]
MTLKNQTVDSVLWSGFEKFTSLFIQMLSTVIIARFISPSDFGLIGMLVVFIAVGNVILGSGFGQALIRKMDATDLDFSSVFYLNLFLGFIIYIILFFLSPNIASFYSQPELEKIAKIAFLVIPINAFGLIQFTLFNKNLDFKSLSKISIISALISGFFGIFLAYKYQNVWALVIQNVLFYLLRTLFLWIVSSWTPLFKFSIYSIKGMFSFSINLLITGLIGSIYNNLYSIVIGKFYAPIELGYYTQADRFQKVPSGSITGVIQSVTFPVLSKIQNKNDILRENYLKIIGIAFLIVSPIMMYLMVISENLFEILLTSKWHQSSIYFKFLCIVGALYPLSSINLNILNIKGKGKLILRLEIVRKAILSVILMITYKYGMMVLMYGLVFYSLCQLILNTYWSGKQISLTLHEQFKDLSPIILANFIAVIFTIPLNMMSTQINLILLLFLQLIVFSSAYLLACFYLNNRFLNYLRKILIEKYFLFKKNK